MGTWLIRKLDDLVSEVVGVAAVAFLLAGGIAVWTYIDSGNGPLVILAFLFTVVAVISAANQVHLLASGVRGPRNDEELGEHLSAWAFEHGYQVKKENQNDAVFEFNAFDFQGRPLLVIKPRNEANVFRIVSQVGLSDASQAAFQSLPAESRIRALAAVRVEMARAGVRYRGISDPFTSAQLNIRVLSQGIDRYVFIEQLQRMTNAVVAFVEVIRRETAIALPAGSADAAQVLDDEAEQESQVQQEALIAEGG